MPASLFPLANLYFWFFALLGALLPYWSLYLEDRGFSYMEIALLMATLQGTKVIAPNVWGWLGDRTGRRLALVRLGSASAILCFLGVFLEPGFWGLALVILLFSFFWNAILPLYEVITLHNLGEARHRYGQVRLWGSVGFIASVGLLGLVLEWIPVSWLPWLLMPLFVGILVSSLMVHGEPPVRREAHHGPLSAILCQRVVIAFFLMNFLLQASHGPYYAFFSIHLKKLGYTEVSVGFLWSLGVVAEILLFVIMHRLLRQHSLRAIALVALLLTAFRWALTALYSESMAMLIPVQCLHAASYGALHAVSIHFIHRHFGEGHQGQGQALYSGLSFGAGGAVGAGVAGLLVEADGTQLAFWAAAGVALLATVVSWWGLRPSRDQAFA